MSLWFDTMGLAQAVPIKTFILVEQFTARYFAHLQPIIIPSIA
jgi:hypothetical protein